VAATWDPTWRVIESTAIPTTLGGGSEDCIVAFFPDDLRLWTRPATVEAFREGGVATGAVRLRIYGYAALTADRYGGKSVGVMSGSGLGSISWT
ncbi:MAG TPA: hypothetical protein VMT10_07400, partial [Solirubrobacteraceae bacterium]|nr:hypothetical protein [Solirubrobacteraceae bacterium]